MRRYTVGTLVLCAVAAAAPVPAQDAAAVAAGDKVRFQSPRGPRFTALVLEAGPEALVVRVSPLAAPTRVELAGLHRLEVARGQRTRFREGFLLGFFPGALYWLAGAHEIGCDRDCRAKRDLSVNGSIVVVCGTVTGLIGGVIGARYRTERWLPVPTARGAGPRVGLSLLRAHGGVSGRVSVAF